MMKRIVLVLSMSSLAFYGQSQKGGDSSGGAPGKQVSPSGSINAL
jgi:hypothetical protein